MINHFQDYGWVRLRREEDKMKPKNEYSITEGEYYQVIHNHLIGLNESLEQLQKRTEIRLKRIDYIDSHKQKGLTS